MITTDLTYRSLVKNNAFSAFFDLSLSNVTGQAEIGFSGEGKKYKFNFNGGKMFDDEGRYFSSYLPNDSFSLNTNISGTAYDYSVNDQVVTYSGAKQDFNAERFYVQATGVAVNHSIIINSTKPTLTLNYPSTFVTGYPITGYLTTNSVNGVKLFTGQFEDLSSFQFDTLPTGYITSTNSGQVVISQKENNLGDFVTQASFNTNAGSYSQNVEIQALENSFLNYTFHYSQSGQENWTEELAVQGEFANITKTVENTFVYNFNTNDTDLEPNSLPLTVLFSYSNGTTGNYGLVSDVTVSNGGNGYTATPTVTFSGGGATLNASGVARLGKTISNYDQVQSIELTSRGAGYTSAPTVSFSNTTGVINNTNPTSAVATATVSTYEKSFTGAFNIYTGINGKYVNFKSNSKVDSNNNYSGTISYSNFDTPINIKIDYNTTLDTNELVGLLTVSGVNGTKINTYVTGVK